ncbi:hypothetical protein AgCh_023987 [Apium graveolens]
MIFWFCSFYTWKALDFAALKRSLVSYFDDEKQETAISKWAWAKIRASKVGKGLSKSKKAKKLIPDIAMYTI